MKKVPTPISVMVMRKVYLRPIEVAEPAEEQRAERAHRKTGGEGEQREDESRRRIDAGKELRGQNGRQRAVDIEVVPLEYCAERRSEDDHPLLGCHRSFLI